MSNLVIVAIPDENDRVSKVSSEPIPHLTLLYLGDSEEVNNTDQIVQFVEHAANTTLQRFYLPVDRRGELGDDPELGPADVLFFRKGRWGYKDIRDFRVQLLKNDNIRTAYDSAKQHEGPWIPHLTLGYKNRPAKEDPDRDFGFYDVSFNRIAVWVDEYDGPEFLLKDWSDEWETMEAAPVDVAMSEASEAGSDYILEHYGVKGMKWGVRNQETKGAPGTSKRWFDPEGHDLATDVAKNLILGTFALPLAIPSAVRLNVGAYRGVKAKVQDVAEKHDDKKFEKVAKSQEAFVAIHNGSADKFNSDVAKVNKRYTEADLANPAKKKAYDKEVQKTMQEAYRDSANRIGNKRGTKHLDVEFQPNGEDFAIKVKEGQQKPTVEKVKHAYIEDDDTVTFVGQLKRAATGHIVGFEFEDFKPNPMIHSAEMGAEYMVFNGMMDPDEFLEHFGVKGMRWGVTREHVTAVGNAAKSTGGALGKAAVATGKFVGDVNFEAKIDKKNNPEGAQKVEQEIKSKAHQAFKRTDLPAIKDKPEYQAAKKLRNRLRHPKDPATKAYRKEIKAAYISRLEGAANSMTNTSGTRQYTIRERGWETPPEGGALPKSKYYWDVTSRQVKHADDGDLSWTMEVNLDEDGFVSDIAEVDTMAQSIDDGAHFLAALGIIGEDELEHYGVKGMQWGIRRSRESPMAVTPVGRSRVPHGDKRKTKIDTEGGQNHEATPDAIRVAEHREKLKKSGVHALSNNELRELNQRLQLETQAAQLTSSRGQKFIQRQLEQQGQMAVQTGVKKGVKKGIKKAGKAAATTAVTVALL